MTTIRMEAGITDDSYGSNDYHMDVTSDVPPEAGPWDDWGYVADVFKHIIEGLDSQADELCFVDWITFSVEDVELLRIEPEPNLVETDNGDGTSTVTNMGYDFDAAHAALALMKAWDATPSS